MSENASITPDCPLDGIETEVSVNDRMDRADLALAEELGIPFVFGETQGVLVEMAQRQAFPETPIAMQWYAAYSAWADWAFERCPEMRAPLAPRETTDGK